MSPARGTSGCLAASHASRSEGAANPDEMTSVRRNPEPSEAIQVWMPSRERTVKGMPVSRFVLNSGLSSSDCARTYSPASISGVGEVAATVASRRSSAAAAGGCPNGRASVVTRMATRTAMTAATAAKPGAADDASAHRGSPHPAAHAHARGPLDRLQAL